MGRGGQIYLSYTALILLSAASGAAANLWTVDIDESPAPSPQDGPPFSANASRDISLLPFQIVGIVGSYVCSILIIGFLLLTVGRRARQRAQMMATIMTGTEMVKPMGSTFDPSPVSPQSQRDWYSPRRLAGRKNGNGSIKSATSTVSPSPAMDSVVTFDMNVVEADRQKRAEEMERLYAAVMGQPDNSTSRPTKSSMADPALGPPPEYSRRMSSRLADAPNLRHLQAGSSYHPQSPRSPTSPVRAIYPPYGPILSVPTGPASPVRAGHTTAPLSPTYPSDARPPNERTTSYGSAKSVATSASPNKKPRKSLRSLKISAPIIRPDSDNDHGARIPLSPRFYTDAGIPPGPPTARTVDTTDSAWYPPTTPGTARSFGFDDDFEPEVERMDEIRALPHPYPQRTSAAPPQPPQLQTSFSPPRPSFSPREKQAGASAASLNDTLPFRQYQSSAASSSSAAPYQPYAGLAPASAGPIKTTFVESRRDRLAAGTPRTGMATPYSAYMPTVPVTPVTPYLTSRAERKQRAKESRALRGAITEEDRVVDDDEMWGDGYS